MGIGGVGGVTLHKALRGATSLLVESQTPWKNFIRKTRKNYIYTTNFRQFGENTLPPTPKNTDTLPLLGSLTPPRVHLTVPIH